LPGSGITFLVRTLPGSGINLLSPFFSCIPEKQQECMEMSYSMDVAMSNGTIKEYKATNMNQHQMHRLPFYTETCYKSFRKGFYPFHSTI
jgi:hypothetical protein